MGDINFIVIISESNFKLKRVIIAATFLFERVLIVSDVLAIAIPADTPGSLSLLRRVEERLLALVVAAIVLDEVDDRELILGVFSDVRNLEVKPLGVGRSVVIVLQDQRVAVGVVLLVGAAQVRRFKARLENQSRVLAIGQLVEGLE